jgi:phosphoribosylformylglycinamidine cyclo-ligase
MMNNSDTPKNLTYRDAGVDIEAGDRLVEDIKIISQATHRPEVLGSIGGFSGLFELKRYKNPVLVSATDGVGTKLLLANQLNKHEGVGIDLVAMCVNDLIVCGAEPLFFLDYVASGKLDLPVLKKVITSIGEGCQQAGAALVGGETAEMPGMYTTGDYDLAGFAVGVVEKSAIIDGSQINVGDAIIALGSQGPHSNGYSLIRKIIEVSQTPLDSVFDNGQTLADILMQPTRIYVKSVRALCQKNTVHGIAHITGGGLLENIPRILPPNTCAELNHWQWPRIFHWLQQHGHIDNTEMVRTFNCGIGMIVIVAPENLHSSIELLREHGEVAWPLGQIVSSTSDDKAVILKPKN